MIDPLRTGRFFIVGCPRSGTTLLSVLLDRHSRLCVPPETAFYDEVAPQLRWRAEARLVRVLQEWRRLPELEITPAEVRTHLGTAPVVPANVLGTILDLYAKVRGKARCGEKTPQHLLHGRTILRDFPDAKIVCVVRDARDNALSLNAMPWWQGNLRAAARLWARFARLAAKFEADHPDRFLVTYYEDLVSDPEPCLQRVMQHLGENFEQRQLDPAIESRTVLPRSLVWKGQALRPVDAGEAGRRRDAADPREIQTIERIAGRELRLHGYESATSPSRLSRLFRLA